MKEPITSSEPSSGRGHRDRLLADLVVRFHAPLKAFFRRRTGDNLDSEDLAQEVFVRLTRHADLNAIDNIDGYVFQTAANLLRDRIRRQAVRHADSHIQYEDQLDPAGFSPERVLLGKDALERLVAAVHELPEKTRMIFALYHFDSMSHAAIERRLGIPISTIEKHMARANVHLLRRMRQS